jgi:hypothetical protein
MACRHKWEPVGGCKENPGVMDSGRGSIVYLDTCTKCGRGRRVEASYCGRTSDKTYFWQEGQL